jgi:NADH-quinone oxidoreductase subunit J
MIFAIMLTPNTNIANQEGTYRIPALVVGALFAIGVSIIVLRTDWGTSTREAFATTATAIGGALLDKYVLPFEIAGVLLTIALIGAVVLVREESEG